MGGLEEGIEPLQLTVYAHVNATLPLQCFWAAVSLWVAHIPTRLLCVGACESVIPVRFKISIGHWFVC